MMGMHAAAGRSLTGLGHLHQSVTDILTTPRYMLRYAFESARAKAAADNPKLEAAIRNFQFRDLRAKAGTDTEGVRGIDAAQAQLGHSTATMAAHYVRHRRGKLVKPRK